MGQDLRIGDLERRPIPLDPERAEAWARDLAAAAEQADAPRLSALMRSGAELSHALAAIMDLSPYLGGTMLRRPDWMERLFDEDSGARIAAILEELRAPLEPGVSESATMTRLREAKAEASLLIGLRDLLGAVDEKRTTADLSDLAEAAIGHGLRFCLLDLHKRGQLALPDEDDPERGCGLVVLGMGKLGGRELNYSSDVDLILFFDPDVPAILDRAESVETFSRLARRLVRLIGERTRDGYVFRTDLRLRPDPSAMPLAIPLPTAIVYYESAGRDWERAAMIKARAIAGDRAVGEEFIEAIGPFVWRRYLDFAAIRDIRAMKDRMDAHRGLGGPIRVPGHNVKLGRGGIREVEFFVQTQQLVAAGRAPELRLRRTDETLAALAEGGWIEAETAQELTAAYWFLRRIEHVVQMIADEQTHTLPETEEDLLRVARLAGFETVEAFRDRLLSELRTVERRYAGLFAGGQAEESHPALGALGDAQDETALNWLAAEGYRRPQDVARVLSAWGAGRYRALRSKGARERMTLALPAILGAFGDAPDPDAAIVAFDRFLARLPAGIQFFALVQSNPKLLDLLALILTAAPGLAATIGERPHVFDALLDPAFYGERPDASAMRERLTAVLDDAPGHEERLAALRVFAAEQRFLIGVRLLSGALEGEAAGIAFSDVAAMVIGALLASVQTEFERAHGRVARGRIALIGLGRLGSRELTSTSDVDLILVYDHAEGAEESDGGRPLPVSTYYARLTQRLIAGLASPMADGVLYPVDFRLRPSGNKGPLATELNAFRRYQESEAWTWEHMALTRSHAIAGDPALCETVEAVVRAIVERDRDADRLKGDVASMRARIERDKPGRGPLDIKLRAGGLVDLEFIAQSAILSGAVPPGFCGRPTAEVLAAFEVGEGGEPVLAPAMAAFTRAVQVLRLGADGARSVADLPRGLAERLAEAIEADGPDGIEDMIAGWATKVRARFEALFPVPENDD